VGENQQEIQGGGKQASAQHQAASLASDIRVILCYLIVAFVINDIQQVFDIVLHDDAPWLKFTGCTSLQPVVM
jgi:hypothetical protein